MDKRMKRVLLASLMGVFVAVFVTTSLAEEEERGKRRERARMALVLRIVEALDLSDEKALQVGKILKQGAMRREALRTQRRALAPELKAAVESEDATKIDAAVRKARQVDRQVIAIAGQNFDEIEALLTPVERGKLALLLPEIDKQLRGRRGRRRGRSGPRGGPRERRGGDDARD